MIDDLADVSRGPLRITLPKPGRPSVKCFVATGTIGDDGEAASPMVAAVHLSPDDAGNLAYGPRTSVELVGQRWVIGGPASSTWGVTVLAFIEEEARARYESVVARWLGRMGDD